MYDRVEDGYFAEWARTGETQRHRGHGEKGRDVVRGQGGEMRAGDEVQRAERGADYKEFKL